MFNRCFVVSLLAAVTVVCTSFSQAATVTGNVRGADGKIVQGAQVRFEGNGDSSATTDGRGQYVCKNLRPGVYKISVLVNGAVKSTVTVKTTADNARVDFDLKGSPQKTAKHYVWVPARTGSHLGGGWVQVDNNETAVAGDSNLSQGSAEMVRQMQSNANHRPLGQ